MTSCAYCGGGAELTIAMLVPAWYRPEVSDSVVHGGKQVVDVCAACRSSLAAPGAYAGHLFAAQLPPIVFRDTVGTLDLDHALLLRWLLSLSYDAARVHGEDVRILAQYRDVATGRAPIPPQLQLWLRTIAPTAPAGTVFAPAASTDRIVAKPEWFRVGRLGLDEFGCEAWSFRQVAIDSYCFMLLLPDASRHDEARSERLQRSEAIDAALGNPTWIGPGARLWLPAPADDAISFNLQNAGMFPLACERVEEPRLAAALASDTGVVELRIERADVEAGNIGPALAFLAGLLATRESCLRMRQRLSVGLVGYERDVRALLDDHDAVSWLRALDREWPYWMFFLHPGAQWLKLASIWLGNPTRGEDEAIRLDPQALAETVRNWFIALNRLCHVLGIEVGTRKLLSDQAGELLAVD